MPQGLTTDAEGWISSDQLLIPRQTLAKEEVDRFLEFLFANVARRPARVPLREAAGVVRYLRNLAWLGVPSQVVKKGDAAIQEYRRNESKEVRKKRSQVDRLALTIWSVLLQCGDITLARKPTVLGFLKKHKDTYLALEDVGPLTEFIRELEFLPGFKDSFGPPSLMSQNLTNVSPGNPHLQDDLTDRIYAAYGALRREGIRGARPKIADALTRAKVKKRTRAHRRVWTYADVNERIKQHEKQLKAGYQGPREDVKGVLREIADSRADWWILSFRAAMTELSF